MQAILIQQIRFRLPAINSNDLAVLVLFPTVTRSIEPVRLSQLRGSLLRFLWTRKLPEVSAVYFRIERMSQGRLAVCTLNWYILRGRSI